MELQSQIFTPGCSSHVSLMCQHIVCLLKLLLLNNYNFHALLLLPSNRSSIEMPGKVA